MNQKCRNYGGIDAFVRTGGPVCLCVSGARTPSMQGKPFITGHQRHLSPGLVYSEGWHKAERCLVFISMQVPF